MEIDIKKLMTAIIGAAVGLIILASLLVPVLQIATQTTDTFTNNCYFRMTKTSDDLTITYDHNFPSVMTVNGVNVPIVDSTTLDAATTIIAAESSCLRMNTGAGTKFQFFAGNSNTGVLPTEDWSFVASGGTITFTNTTTSAVRYATYTDIYYEDPAGDWCMKRYNFPAYMNGDSFFMGIGMTSSSSPISIIGVNMSGTIDNGANITVWRGSGITISNVNITKTPVSSHLDLYDLDKITFTASNGNGDSLDIVYTYFIVPYQVTAERSEHMSDTEIDLLNLAPTLLIIAIALGLLLPMLRNKE